MTDVGPGAEGTLSQYGYDPSGRLIDRIGISGTKEKRYYADGLSPILVKQWDATLNGGAGGWKTMRTALQTPGVIGHVAAERHATAWNASGTPTSFQDRFYHYDPLGNTVLETGVNATVLARTDMEAYGEMVRESNATGTWTGGTNYWAMPDTPNRPRQTTKETDPDTGLKWFGARWYDPALGSWLSPEPMGLDGPNLYWGISAQPAGRYDWDGRRSFVLGLGWGLIPEHCIRKCKRENPFNIKSKPHQHVGWYAGYYGFGLWAFDPIGIWFWEFPQGCGSLVRGDDFFDDDTGYNSDGSPRKGTGWQEGDIRANRQGWDRGDTDREWFLLCIRLCVNESSI
jgi:RHS repeat-associated protein